MLRLGAAAVIDTTREPAQVIDSVRKASASRGVDLVLDHLCGPNFVVHLQMLVNGGLLVSYNALLGPAEGDAFAALRSLATKGLGIVVNMHTFNGDAMRDARRRLLDTPMQWLARGKVRPAIGARLELDDIRCAHALLDAGGPAGKLVLEP